MKLKLALIIVGFASLLLGGCSIVPTLRRAPESYPQTDIVFQRAMHPSDAEELRYSLGFVNADGSGLSVVELGRWGALVAFPAWSPDGSLLAFRGGSFPNSSSGDLLVARAGKIVLHCSATFGFDGISLLEGAKQAVIELRAASDKLVLVDLSSCRVVHTYVQSQGDTGVYDEMFFGASMDPSGQWLVFGRSIMTSSSEESADTIVLLEVAAGTETVIASGINPAWSPDGQWIAYVGKDGIYVTRQDGTETKRVSTYSAYRQAQVSTDPVKKYMWEDFPPLPSWSPDGKWVVYHKCMLPLGRDCREKVSDFAIFKVNVETTEETKILDGGVNPYWRKK